MRALILRARGDSMLAGDVFRASRPNLVEALHAGCLRASRTGVRMGAGGKGGYMDKLAYERWWSQEFRASFCFWTRVWAAKIVVSTGLREG